MAERKPFLLRLPADLHDEVRRWADDDLRSMNAQIEFLLRAAVRARRGGRPGPDPAIRPPRRDPAPGPVPDADDLPGPSGLLGEGPDPD